MKKITIAVGSTRKPKLNAVWDAVNTFASGLDPDAQYGVVGLEVDSGVGHTPSTCRDLMRGARHRAEALAAHARERAEDWQYFVGLEGGLEVLEENGNRRVLLESWAYVTDGRRGHFGRSGGIELPEALASEVLQVGVELSVAIDKFAGAAGIRDNQGAWGVLSNNFITRQEAFRIAVIAGFAPFYNEKMYRAANAASSPG
jgi:inosine/xanthosine triphosphatase